MYIVSLRLNFHSKGEAKKFLKTVLLKTENWEIGDRLILEGTLTPEPDDDSGEYDGEGEASNEGGDHASD